MERLIKQEHRKRSDQLSMVVIKQVECDKIRITGSLHAVKMIISNQPQVDWVVGSESDRSDKIVTGLCVLFCWNDSEKTTLSVSLTGDMDHFVMSNLTNFTITKICETKTILKLKHHQDRVLKLSIFGKVLFYWLHWSKTLYKVIRWRRCKRKWSLFYWHKIWAVIKFYSSDLFASFDSSKELSTFSSVVLRIALPSEAALTALLSRLFEALTSANSFLRSLLFTSRCLLLAWNINDVLVF